MSLEGAEKAVGAPAGVVEEVVDLPAEVEELYRKLDTDGDGKVTRKEFIDGVKKDEKLRYNFVQRMKESGVRETWDEVFTRLDGDGSEYISKAEIMKCSGAVRIMKRMSKEAEERKGVVQTATEWCGFHCF